VSRDYERIHDYRHESRLSGRAPLRRDPQGAWLGGVCAGIGRYLDVDPNLIRIAATLGLFTLTSTTILAYLIAWVIVPRTWRD
jgi:phage shock protein C